MLVTVLNGFSGSQRFETANLTGPVANTSSFSVWCVFLPSINQSNQFLFGKATGIGSNVGWSFANGGGYGLRVGDGSTVKLSPRVGFTSDELNKIQIVHCVIENGEMVTYKNGFKADGLTVISSIGSYTGPTRFGSFSGGTQYLESIISFGVCENHALSNLQVESHYQDLLLNLETSAPNASYHWVSEDAGITWTDRISSLSATRTGTISPTNVDVDFPQYRFIDVDFDFDNTPMLPKITNTDGNMKVLCVGDSRTFGAGGTGSNAWRNRVTLLKNATSDINFIDFVGSRSSTASDPEHFAWSGSDNRDHVNVTGDVNLSPSSLVSTYNPSVIIHWLGVNGSNYNEDINAEKQAYLDLLRAYYNANNNIRFLLLDEATISDSWHNAGLENFRIWQRNIAWPMLRSEGLKIYTVYNPLKPSLGHYADPLHPNDTGYEIIANSVYTALRNVFGVDYVEPIPKIVGVSKLVGITKLKL